MLRKYSVKKFLGLLCKAKDLNSVTDQHPEPDESSPHNPIPFFYHILFLFFLLRSYLPNGIILRIFSTKICMRFSSMRVRCFVKTLVNFYSLILGVFGDLVIMVLLGCSIQFCWYVLDFTSKYSSCNIFLIHSITLAHSV